MKIMFNEICGLETWTTGMINQYLQRNQNYGMKERFILAPLKKEVSKINAKTGDHLPGA